MLRDQKFLHKCRECHLYDLISGSVCECSFGGDGIVDLLGGCERCKEKGLECVFAIDLFCPSDLASGYQYAIYSGKPIRDGAFNTWPIYDGQHHVVKLHNANVHFIFRGKCFHFTQTLYPLMYDRDHKVNTIIEEFVVINQYCM